MMVKELNLELEHLNLVLIHMQHLPINEEKDDYSNRNVKQKRMSSTVCKLKTNLKNLENN